MRVLTTDGVLSVGSLFSGVGGLDMGVLAALTDLGYDAVVAWHVEYEDAPSKVLAHHWPGVPNYGDVTSVNWSTVAPIHVLCLGFPCQDVSLAGLRRGLMTGTRSGLWAEAAVAIAVLRPRLVVIENVRGLLSAAAGDPQERFDEEEAGYLESESWDMGEASRGDGPVLRALGAVLGDLADIGYVGRWCGVRASDAGAPHGRFRVFIIAEPADTQHVWRSGGGDARRRWAEPTDRGDGAASNTDALGRGPHLDDVLAGQPHVAGRVAPADAPSVAGSIRNGDDVRARRRTKRREQNAGRSLAADTSGQRLGEHARESPSQEARALTGDLADGDGGPRPHTNWGPYRPAVERWERTLGRRAPAPTNPDGRDGARRLAPQFTEWMMGLPEGHITDPLIGLSRNAQLKACGNGVVPQQAHLAVRLLLTQQWFGRAA